MGIDRVLKGHYDAHRRKDMVPPELLGKIPGGLYPGDRISMEDLRNWRKGLSVFIDGVELSTAMDDLLFNSATKLYNVIDAKSKAKLTDVEDTQKYYQTQADAYDLALNVNEYQTDGRSFFAYYSPLRVGSSAPAEEVDFRWNCQMIEIKADHASIKALVLKAAACLDSAMPEPRLAAKKGDEGCAVCTYLVGRDDLFEVLRKGAEAAA